MTETEPENMNKDNTLTVLQQNEMTDLSQAIVEWRLLADSVDELRLVVKEKSKKMKALEAVILRVMKNHNINALDLKNSKGRVLYKKSKRQGSLGAKNLQKFLAEALKSEQKATEVYKYMQERREVVTKESIQYEKTDS